LVIKDEAYFRFRHLLTNQLVELRICGSNSMVMEGISRWAHEIINVGTDEMLVLLWAKENFVPEKLDTLKRKSK
jgi:UDP-2-acetamido-2,6-beta-L-arabino-hexul-4-ose reductase